MNILLYLDDVRNPFLRKEDLTIIGVKIEWVRSYEEFVRWINKYGIPYCISFDHDLGEVNTGYDCAKFLVNKVLDENLTLCKWVVHSANPVGKENINCLLSNFKRHLDEMND